MSTIIEYLKKGNLSSAFATLGNIMLTILKAVAAFLSGSGAMFAEAMHSGADTINQGFVFAGSILAEKKPTKRFPMGFGRLINIFCMIAVIVVTVLAYETILEGIERIRQPVAVTNYLLNISILTTSILIDGYVLLKAMREINRETHSEARGLNIVYNAIRSVGKAAPATRLVFYEDLVATSGALIAIIAITLTKFTPLKAMDGIAAVIIGILLLGAAFKVGYDNMIGLIGVAAPLDVEQKIAGIILSDPDVTDINKLRIIQVGRSYHAESYIELRRGLSLAEADDIKFRVRDSLLAYPDVTDVTLGIIEDNGVPDLSPNYTPFLH